MEANADFGALAAQELTFQGPVSDSTGQAYITMFTTGLHASSLEPFGFRLRGYANPTRDDGVIQFGPLCSSPSSCSTPTNSAYFMSYDEIVAELEDMAAVATGAVTLVEIGTSQQDGRPIVAVQFGPLEGADTNPPTLYLLGTYHAREWLTTAVAIQHARWLYELVTTYQINGTYDFDLAAALTNAAIVIVPVVNPDGYEYSRNVDRAWRGNRNVTACLSGGVDLNRNHSTAWNEPAPLTGTSPTCSSFGNYRGPAAASERETQAIEQLLTGGAFPAPQRPAALISYHSYADMVVYPDGYKAATNSDGPKCGLTDAFNCFNADFTLLRDVFGDTHSDLFVDDVSYLPTVLEFPYYRDHGRTTLYAVSGDANLHATYGPVPMLAITPELPSACYGFGVECDPNADDVVFATASDQLDVIRRALPRASALLSTDPSMAYGPSAVGTVSSGLWTREYGGIVSAASARATFIKSVFIPASTGSLTASIGSPPQTYPYKAGRRGAQYELYSLRLADEAKLDPLCLPCEVVTTAGEAGGTDSAVDCSECIDVCDPNRLAASGWEIRNGTRGGAADCWWTATQDDGVLVVPGGTTPKPDTTHCHLTFSAEWGSLTTSQIWIEREAVGGGWETLMTARYEQPYNGGFFPSNRLVSYAFEANSLLGSGRVPSFRLRVDGAAPASETVHIFDPVIYCRNGGLP